MEKRTCESGSVAFSRGLCCAQRALIDNKRGRRSISESQTRNWSARSLPSLRYAADANKRKCLIREIQIGRTSSLKFRLSRHPLSKSVIAHFHFIALVSPLAASFRGIEWWFRSTNSDSKSVALSRDLCKSLRAQKLLFGS